MNIPSVDKRSKKEIIKYMKKIARSYTPEWNFDENNPDIGTALAMIYSDMHYETIKRLNRAVQKTMYDFFNTINAEMLPASAAEGYVSFGLSDKTMKYKSEVKSGTKLMADNKSEQIFFQTTEDVLVNNSAVKYVYLSNGREDVIGKLFDGSEDEAAEIKLFSMEGRENIQSHIMSIYHNDVFNIHDSAYIGIRFIKNETDKDNISEILEKAVSEQKIRVQYNSVNGYVDFLKITALDDGITVYKSHSQPEFLLSDGSYEIRIISVSPDFFLNKSFRKIECFSKGKDIIPEAVFTNDIEKNVNSFYPFNEKPFQYDEFYIASGETFCKKGAEIEVSFYVDFDKIMIEEEQQAPKIEYKLIMKHSQFQEDEKFDITIDEVIWEYFNGKGWARLFKDNSYSDVFNPKNGRKTKNISFICPDDMEKLTVNSRESYYIRARVLRLNNQFKNKGYFISPVVNEINISYFYSKYEIPEKIVCINNTEQEVFFRNHFNDYQDSAVTPFRYLKNDCPEVYFGFSYPPEYGPVRFLFSMKDNVSFETFKLKWSYLTKNGWKQLAVFDETENFRKTGVMTFIGNNEFKEEVIFGKSAYWIKASDFQNGYGNKKNRFFPVIENIYNNIAPVMNVTDMPEEKFSIEPFEENKVCRLSSDKIYKMEVWVDEISELVPDEIEELKSKEIVEITEDMFGIPVNIWVKWSETADLNFSSPNDRHFKADKNIGTVTFGNNIHGKIPAYKNGNTIKIKYSSGGGKNGNVEKGSISKINQSLGFVTEVYNPMITYGGADVETAEQAIERSSSRLRNCGRAVTAFDYETLAMEAERSLLKVKCIPNMLPNGTKSFGNIMLVILIQNYDKEKGYFLAVKDRIEKYISAKMSGSIYDSDGLHIIQPQFVYYDIKAEISVKSFKNIFDIKSAVENRIMDFLDISTGNFNNTGWEIGELPNSLQILNAIKDVRGVSFIKNISVNSYINIDSEIYDVDINNLKGKEFSLAFSGKHDIVMTVE